MKSLSTVIAFGGDPAFKQKCYEELKQDVYDGNFIGIGDVDQNQQMDWEDPVEKHYLDLEVELGIPLWFLVLSEWLAAKMPDGEGAVWAARLLQAIPAGALLDQVWPHFAQALLRSNGYGALYFVSGREQMTAVIHLSTLHKLSQPDAHSFEKAAERLRHLAAAGDSAKATSEDTAATSAIVAAYWTACASWTGSYAANGAYARHKAARAVLLASSSLVRAVMAHAERPIKSAAEAYALQAHALLEIVQAMPAPTIS